MMMLNEGFPAWVANIVVPSILPERPIAKGVSGRQLVCYRL